MFNENDKNRFLVIPLCEVKSFADLLGSKLRVGNEINYRAYSLCEC